MTDEIEGTGERRRKRLLDASEATTRDPEMVAFQHSVLAQTGLPYRNPGDDVRVWERNNGQASLQVAAGSAMHPELCRLVPLGLPYGPKPRLTLQLRVPDRFVCRRYINFKLISLLSSTPFNFGD